MLRSRMTSAGVSLIDRHVQAGLNLQRVTDEQSVAHLMHGRSTTTCKRLNKDKQAAT